MKRYLLLLLCTSSLLGFQSLQQAMNYADNHPEFPPIENEYILNPRYKAFDDSIQPTWLSSFFTQLGLQKPYWHVMKLGEAVQEYLVKNEKHQPLLLLNLPQERNSYSLGVFLARIIRSYKFLRNSKSFQYCMMI